MLKRWLAIDAANRVAWADVNAAWNDFDDGDDDEILIAMRVDARRAAKRRAKEDGR
ncbi:MULTISPECIES: hypothetical protein [Phenylobacterium]|uniref:Ferric-dicitrate binding protein FerR (Iron transport regulator) n=1 Tax=Phenylobacterium koreense TaxID=266125 RepID=A0ABV2END2_9CAUL